MFEERPDTRDVILNVVAFQAGWLALVLAPANGVAYAGFAAAAAVIALHLWRSPDGLSEAKLLLAAAGLGLVVESAVLRGGFVGYTAAGSHDGIAPLWLVMMWPVFATSVNVTFRSFRNWTVAAAAFGFAFVPIAYLAGVKLGAMTMPEPIVRSLAAIGLGWAIALPLMFWLGQRLDGWRTE